MYRRIMQHSCGAVEGLNILIPYVPGEHHGRLAILPNSPLRGSDNGKMAVRLPPDAPARVSAGAVTDSRGTLPAWRYTLS